MPQVRSDGISIPSMRPRSCVSDLVSLPLYVSSNVFLSAMRIVGVAGDAAYSPSTDVPAWFRGE